MARSGKLTYIAHNIKLLKVKEKANTVNFKENNVNNELDELSTIEDSLTDLSSEKEAD